MTTATARPNCRCRAAGGRHPIEIFHPHSPMTTTDPFWLTPSTRVSKTHRGADSPRATASIGRSITMAHEVPNIALNNGVEMPSIGLGVFQTPPDETRSAVAAALDVGYRHIDTAAAYGNEREVGEAVHASKGGRAAVFLETKIWISEYGDDETLHAFDKRAGKLGVDQID